MLPLIELTMREREREIERHTQNWRENHPWETESGMSLFQEVFQSLMSLFGFRGVSTSTPAPVLARTAHDAQETKSQRSRDRKSA